MADCEVQTGLLARQGVLWGNMSIRPVIVAVVAAFFVACAVIGVNFWIPLDVCNRGGPDEPYKQTVEFLSGILELGLSLSTALVGLSAALLIGLQGSLKLNRLSMSVVLIAMICLASAIVCGVLWKFQIANLWFNACYHLVSTSRIQSFYQAHFMFFLSGVILIGIVVALVGFERLKESSSGGSNDT